MNKTIERLERLGGTVPEAPGFAANVMREVRRQQAPTSERRHLWQWRIAGLAGALAACLLLVIALQHQGSNGVAFGQVIENIRRTETVRLTAISEFGDRTEEWQIQVHSSVGSRVESPNMAVIWNVRSRMQVILLKDHGLATVVPDAAAPEDVYDWLKNLKGDGAVRVGEEVLEELRTVVYKVVAGVPGVPGLKAETTFWIDPEVNLPVRVEQRPIDPPQTAQVPNTLVLKHIRFDVELDEAVFDVEPPAGYEVRHQVRR